MREYRKISSVWRRDSKGTLIPEAWACPEFGYLADCQWTWTEKVDGTNIRIGLESDGEGGLNYRVGGRTDRAQIPATLFDAIGKLDLEAEIRDKFDGPMALYGEGYGARIQQGGGCYRSDQGFVLFDVKVGPWWLQRKDVLDVAASLRLDVVPDVAGVNTLREACDLFTRLAAEHSGLPSYWGDFRSEGIVGVPAVSLCARDGSRVIVKLKHCDFDRITPSRPLQEPPDGK